ncbi:MAG: hypothetical protein KH828_13505 [Clostridiales bacterium]|nr:hypothetical protein [Clostridiales bacterium]
MKPYGQIILLNGTPRSGKSSIAKVIQEKFEGLWVNLGVDNYMKTVPAKYQPAIGLRPGGECPELEPFIFKMYQALYESMAAHSRLGIHVVADLGHHENYSVSMDILKHCAGIIKDYPVTFVGVRCPVDIVMERRILTWGKGYEADGSVPKPVKLWQEAVHAHRIYDLEVDTSVHSPEECADLILEYMNSGAESNAMKVIWER